MDIEKLVEEIGEVINAQITYSWNTRQTAEQYAEILADGGEDTNFTIESFLEYVRSNASDILAATIEEEGRIGIERDILVVDQYGSEVAE